MPPKRTARKAIEGLVAQDRLERHQGRGTFVRRADFGNILFRFFRHTRADGTPLRPTAKLLARRKSKADAATARRLALPAGTATIELFRLHLIEGAPMLAEEIALPHRRFAPLLDLAKDAFGDLLYPLYETACGQIVAQAREHLRFDVGAQCTGLRRRLAGRVLRLRAARLRADRGAVPGLRILALGYFERFFRPRNPRPSGQG